ncbi:alcohol dehydrogenase-like regulatory protein ErcA [Teredinibacter sp. KSP-S5-2]|uniref:alcohol dehydrogenase-like regulatory protein ErcA n=1 Tax=Teredinibacter sp. KSP-S5-2 TaxID=3034506 RepID=UPI002934E427|nr:alcohol dehydrogenase-like regulatory protein ErcA [Teredinibacter sp. KSP-S5-2]WNO08346.1 iron-containing alcohol dehydrogenase [Teredinibacter sp. KSP-S5-2]
MSYAQVSDLRKFVSPEIVFGVGARRSVANFARNFGARRVFVVSDPGVQAAGWLEDVTESLAEAGLEWVEFTGVSSNPRTHEVMAGAELYRESQCDVIVAVGGGSPMDCAKGIGIVSANNKPIIDFKGVDTIPVAIPPLVFIPTTAGSSADVSQFAIISNPEERTKFAIISKTVVPDVALIDPETATTMPSFLTACTGVDALVHAIEAFVSTGAGPLTDMNALDAIKLINNSLPRLIQTPDDLKLREDIMLGSLKAGLAFSNAILGAVHAMSHSLGGYLDLPHGLCNAMLLEHVVAYNYERAQERFKVIAETMGIDTRGLTANEIKPRLLQQLVQLKAEVGICQTLSVSGVHKADIPFLSANAILDPCLITNPRPSNRRDIATVYEEAL